HATPVPGANGEQWPTDAPLRHGMTRLQRRVEAAMAGDPAPSLGDADVTELPMDGETHISSLIEDFQVPEHADAALHQLLTVLLKGAEALSEPEQREQGLQRVLEGLHRYPELFAAPHWSESHEPAI